MRRRRQRRWIATEGFLSSLRCCWYVYHFKHSLKRESDNFISFKLSLTHSSRIVHHAIPCHIHKCDVMKHKSLPFYSLYVRECLFHLIHRRHCGNKIHKSYLMAQSQPPHVIWAKVPTIIKHSLSRIVVLLSAKQCNNNLFIK